MLSLLTVFACAAHGLAYSCVNDSQTCGKPAASILQRRTSAGTVSGASSDDSRLPAKQTNSSTKELGNGTLKELPGKCMDYDTDTDKVYMANCSGGKNQQWYLDIKFPVFTLKSRINSTICMSETTWYHGAGVSMEPCTRTPNQMWRVKPDGDPHQLQNYESDTHGRCLQESGAMNIAGCKECQNVMMKTCSEADGIEGEILPKQQFFFDFDQGQADGKVRTAYRPNFCMAVGDEQADGNVYMAECHGGQSQQWYKEAASESFLMKTRFNDECFEELTTSVWSALRHPWELWEEGHVRMAPCTGERNQLWHFKGKLLQTDYSHSKNKCLEWDRSWGNFYMVACKDTRDLQQFSFSGDVGLLSINVAAD